MIKKLQRWDTISITWVDSANTSRWQHISEANQLDVARCRTVGLFLDQDEEKITVTLNVADQDSEHESFNATMSIPLCSVSKIRLIEARRPKNEPK